LPGIVAPATLRVLRAGEAPGALRLARRLPLDLL